MHRPLIDSHRNFWELTSIQIASMGVLGILLGGHTASQYGVGNAISAICIGNLILWLMGLVIIAMSSQDRVNSIVLIKKILGNGSAILISILLIIVFLIWIIFQIKSSVNVFTSIFKINSFQSGNGATVRLGAALGLAGSLLAIGGARIIKHLDVVCLPFLFIFQFYALSIAGRSDVMGPYWGFSLNALINIVIFGLAGTINLPNFFRHSRSLADSFLSLTLIAFFNCFFQISSIWMDFDALIAVLQDSRLIILIIVGLFIALITFCNILQNVYWASSSWENMLPNFEGSKEYAIIGLAGAAAYTFIQISPPMFFIIDLASNYMANLALVLMLTFLVHLVIRYRPKTFGKWVGSSSWVIGCVFATILKIQHPNQTTDNLLISMGTCALFFLSIMFVEETVWSIKKLTNKNQH